MKRMILWMLCLVLLLAPITEASLGNKGLKLAGGEQEITLGKGEKRRLRVKDGLTGYRLWTGLSFYSDNPLVASVGLHSGVVRGNQPGKATITIVHRSGRSTQITVEVTAGKGTKYLPIFLLLCLGLAGGFLWIRKK